jgi:hypothetical protein
MRASLLFLFVLPFLAGCTDTSHPTTNATASSHFEKRVRCAELSTTGKWEDQPDGPFLDQTYYSPTLDTCVFVMKEAYPDDKDGAIRNDGFIVDALTRKQLWSNDPKTGETEEQLDAEINQELSKLQVTTK